MSGLSRVSLLTPVSCPRRCRGNGEAAWTGYGARGTGNGIRCTGLGLSTRHSSLHFPSSGFAPVSRTPLLPPLATRNCLLRGRRSGSRRAGPGGLGGEPRCRGSPVKRGISVARNSKVGSPEKNPGLNRRGIRRTRTGHRRGSRQVRAATQVAAPKPWRGEERVCPFPDTVPPPFPHMQFLEPKRGDDAASGGRRVSPKGAR